MEKKILKILKKKIFDKDLINFYKEGILKIIDYSNTFLGFIIYDQIYFFFEKLNIKHINVIINIIKNFGVMIFYNIKEDIFLDFRKNFFNNNLKFKDEKNNLINKKPYFKYMYNLNIKNIKKSSENFNKYSFNFIDELLLNFSFEFYRNVYIFETILSNEKYFNKIFKVEDFPPDEFNNFFFNFKNSESIETKVINFIKNRKFTNNCKNMFKYSENLEGDEEFYKNFKNEFLENLKFIIYKYDKNYLLYEKIFNENLNKIKIDFNKFKIIYNILHKRFLKINKIKNKIFDVIVNISNINYNDYVLYFIDNGSNLYWLNDILNFSDLNKNLCNKYKKFINKKKIKLKKIEKKYNFNIKEFLKLFYEIYLLKYKINFIKKNIFESNLHIINKLVIKYKNNEFYFDIIQEGNIGLILAIENYKISLGYNFKNFASKCIKNNISNFLYKNIKLLRIPNYLTDLKKKLNKIYEKYFELYNKKPNLEYLSSKLNLSIEKINKIINIDKEVSLNKKFNDEDEDDNTLEDFISYKNIENSENSDKNDILKIKINESLKDINNKFIKILFLRFGIDCQKKYTLAEIGLKYNLSRERIRQIQNIVLEKLRHPSRSKYLKNFFYNKIGL